MPASVTASEARTRFGRLLERVSQGEEIVVTRYGKPIARLVPVGRPAGYDARAAVSGLRDLRRKIAARRGPGPGFTKSEIKLLIEEGRR